ncbi:FecR domain-containing protein [Porticoccus sp. W117]|uniref:FecR domain-containing protein n=1 Tax=Porticoccus sp. W117 TaxID=3054777 RepID=UPI0025951CC5|nr:FecR domain-containing protein [Porticoccus sp. W117]MDM3870183.1 FecR domain-containing protein [Porticoccus sp. W117]
MTKIIRLALVASYLWLFTPSLFAGIEQADIEQGDLEQANSKQTDSEQASSEQTSSAQEAEWIYYVKKGDTLWDFCNDYLGRNDVINCWKSVQQHNGIGIPKRLHPGVRLRIPISWIQNIPVAAVVEFARGEVRQKKYGASGTLPVVTGDQLHLGTRITVLDGGAVLRFNDGSELLLRHHSELFLQALTTHGNKSARSTLKLNRGSVDVDVPRRQGENRFRVLTPGAVAAVRGTEFRVSAKPDGLTTQVEVLEGGVDVAAGKGGQLVSEGFGVNAVKGQPVQTPVKLLPAPTFNGAKNRFDSGSVTLSWQAVVGASGYQLELYKGADGEAILYQQETAAAEYQFANLPVHAYRLVVRAIASDGLRGRDSAPFHFQTLQKLAAPVFDEASVSYKKRTLAINWSAVENTQYYLLEVSRNADFGEIDWSQQLAETTIAEPLDLRGTFYVRVKAVAEDGRESDYSAPTELKHQSLDWGAILASVAAVLLIAL